jgi:predicted RecA/RadA family phage recombinase
MDVQPSGKPRMTAAAWARGRGVQVGDAFAVPSSDHAHGSAS